MQDVGAEVGKAGGPGRPFPVTLKTLAGHSHHMQVRPGCGSLACSPGSPPNR